LPSGQAEEAFVKRGENRQTSVGVFNKRGWLQERDEIQKRAVTETDTISGKKAKFITQYLVGGRNYTICEKERGRIC